MNILITQELEDLHRRIFLHILEKRGALILDKPVKAKVKAKAKKVNPDDIDDIDDIDDQIVGKIIDA